MMCHGLALQPLEGNILLTYLLTLLLLLYLVLTTV